MAAPSSLVIFVCGGILLLFLANQATSIKCYQCNSYYDRGCSDFFDNRTYPIRDCLWPPNATMCRKIVQETYFDGKYDVRYIRQCAARGTVGRDSGRWCTERAGMWRIKVRYCHCDNKDGCNTATPQSSTTFLTPLLAVALLISWLLSQRTLWPTAPS